MIYLPPHRVTLYSRDTFDLRKPAEGRPGLVESAHAGESTRARKARLKKARTELHYWTTEAPWSPDQPIIFAGTFEDLINGLSRFPLMPKGLCMVWLPCDDDGAPGVLLTDDNRERWFLIERPTRLGRGWDLRQSDYPPQPFWSHGGRPPRLKLPATS